MAGGAGGGPLRTATVVDALVASPSALRQVSPYVVVACGRTVALPLGDCSPIQPPVAVQATVLAVLQVSMLVPPASTVGGWAVKAWICGRAGGGGVAGSSSTTSCARPSPPASKYSMRTVWRPAVSGTRASSMVMPCTVQLSITLRSFTKTRTPSSVKVTKRAVPPLNANCAVQRAEKLSTGRRAGSGLPWAPAQ